ncbi:helicase-related protein [Candidatus Mycalebacterium sp.]
MVSSLFLDEGESLGSDFESFKSSLDLTKDIATCQTKKDDFKDELSVLFDKIKHFSVRETKRSSGLMLPDKDVKNIDIQMQGKQSEIYSLFERDIRVEVRKNGKEISDNIKSVLKRLMRLVQVASNPLIVDDSYDETPTKFIKLRDMLKDIVASNSKAIVWTSFIKNADWLTSSLKELNAVKVHGKMGMDSRNSNLRRFKEQDECKVLVATPASSKEGLTLTQANWCIFMTVLSVLMTIFKRRIGFIASHRIRCAI